MDIYKFHIDLYRRDTRHLSAFEDGVYRRLIDEYMADECPLPDNDKALANVARITLEEWQPIAPTMRAFFTLKNGRLIHKRCEIVLAEWRRYSKHQSEKGKKRHADHDKYINELPATAEPRLSQASAEPQPRVKSEEKEKKETLSPARVNGVHLIKPDWQPSQETIDAIRMTYHLTAQEVADEIPRFRDRQLADAKIKSDWDAEFRVWNSRTRQFADVNRGRKSATAGRGGNRQGPTSQVELIARAAARREAAKSER